LLMDLQLDALYFGLGVGILLVLAVFGRRM
jgi:hypothetical protein